LKQSAAVREIAQILNGGRSSGRTGRLAWLMGASVATVRSWGASGSSEGRKRLISSTARRLLFLLLALHEGGHDLDKLRVAARRLEREYLAEGEDE
jgi:hypothetical protein